MRKFILSALSLVMLASVGVSAATDTSEHWAKDYISQAESENWIDMRDDGSFSPDMNASRQEVAYMVYQSQKDSLDESKRIAVTNFSDSDQIGEKYITAVEVLAGNGIINGYEDGTFRPLSNITRAELTVMISSFISDSKPFNNNYFGYNDAELIPAWAESYITRCSKAGLIKGYSDNTFRPNVSVTRAEAVTMIVNLESFNYVEPETETTTSDTYKVIRRETAETTTTASKSVTVTEADTETVTATTAEEETETTTEAEDGINVEYDKTRAEELAQEINNKRLEAGVNTLELDETLCKIATLKAEDMYKTGCLEDNSDTYGGIHQMLGKFDVSYKKADQTFASGVERAEDVISIFENDETIRQQYLANGYEQMGIGYYNGYWSLIYKE